MLHYKSLQFCLRLGGKAFCKLINNAVYWVNEWKKMGKGWKMEKGVRKTGKKNKKEYLKMIWWQSTEFKLL